MGKIKVSFFDDLRFNRRNFVISEINLTNVGGLRFSDDCNMHGYIESEIKKYIDKMDKTIEEGSASIELSIDPLLVKRRDSSDSFKVPSARRGEEHEG